VASLRALLPVGIFRDSFFFAITGLSHEMDQGRSSSIGDGILC